MNLSRLCLLLLACFTLPALQAQTAAEPANLKTLTSKKADKADKKNKDKDKSEEPKISQAEMEKIHQVAVLVVNFGGEDYQILFELLPQGAPKTVANFLSNVEKNVYPGMAFHRTIDNYLVQTGDTASKNNDNRAEWGLTQEYTIPGEFKLPHVTGAVAMARRGDKVNPDKKSDGTQFYFVLGNMSHLSGQYTVFGQVVSGMDTLKRISRTVHDSNDCPLERIEIKSVKVIEHTGPVAVLNDTANGDGRRVTKPDALKGPFEKILTRIW
jgi:cyclophilin family peptidyl-prolyl cis-trans isomerase